MLDLLKNSWLDFQGTYKKHLVFTFIYAIITSIIFVPLIANVFNRVLRAMGANSLLNSEIFRILLDPRGILGLIIIGIIAVTVIFVEFGVLTIISQKKYFHKNVSIVDAFLTMLKKTPRVLGFGMIQLMFLFLFLIPFIDMPLSSTLIQDIYVPEFFMKKIFASEIFFVLYLLGLIAVIYIFLRWIFAIHCIVIEGMPTKAAIRRSLEMTRGNVIKILVILFLLNVVTFAAGLAIIATVNSLSNIIEVLAANHIEKYFIENYFITFSSLITYMFGLMLTPINIIFITRLYYQYCLQQGIKPKDNLTINTNNLLSNIEEKMFNFFLKKKHILILILTINLIGTVQLNSAVTDSFINAGRNVYVIAHRGGHGAPENSLSIIKSALEKQVDFIEIDVQLTRDGVVVLHHDRTLQRVAGVPYSIHDLDYHTVANIDIGRLYSIEFAGERIPTLEQVLKEVKGKARVLVDLKPFGSGDELAKKVAELIVKMDMIEDVYVQSFNYSVLERVRKENPYIKTGQILYLATGELASLDVDFYAVDKGMLSNRFISDARRKGREVFVWTLNTEKEMKEALRYDIDGIITNYPEKLQNILKPALVDNL